MSGTVVVKPVQNKKELKNFILFPYRLYKKILKNPYWAAPLRIDENTLFNRKKNPFYEHADVQEFLAYKEGRIAGRVSGIIDSLYHKHREEGVAFFGFFECINDQEVAFRLLDAVTAWAHGKGMKKTIGPINLSTNHILGTLLNDFDGVPMVQVPYNPEYYPGFFDGYGFEKEKDHLAYFIDTKKNELSDKIRRVVNLVRNNKRITLRTVNMKDYWNDVKLVRKLYNKSWENNSDFVPWTDAEFTHLAKDLKLAVIPELTFLAFVDGKLAGVSIPLYNFNEILVRMNGRLFPLGIIKLLTGIKKLTSLRLAIMGVLPEYRRMGIDALFVLETYERGVAMGYRSGEVSLILEDNWMLVNMLNKWGARLYRTYRVYGKELA